MPYNYLVPEKRYGIRKVPIQAQFESAFHPGGFLKMKSQVTAPLIDKIINLLRHHQGFDRNPQHESQRL